MDKNYIWTLKIEVQGKNEADATPRIEDRIKAFVARGASIGEGEIREKPDPSLRIPSFKKR